MRDASRTILERASVLPRGVFFAVGVGAAFGLGIVVAGGIGEARGSALPTADVLARAERTAQVYEQKRAALKLTYAAELQRPDPVRAEKLGEKPASAVEPAAETAPAHLETPPEDPPPAPPPASPPAPAPAAAPAAAAHATAAHAASDDDDDDNDDKADDRRIQRALAKVLGTVPAGVDDHRASAPTYALQVASLPTREGAEAFAKKLPGARVAEGEVGGKSVFRVRLGAYAARAAAEAAKAKLALPSFIVAE